MVESKIRPIDFRRALAAFHRAQRRFYGGYDGAETPDAMRLVAAWNNAKSRIIHLILAANGQDWGEEKDYIRPAAVILPDGMILATRMNPEDDEDAVTHLPPVLVITPPERVARL